MHYFDSGFFVRTPAWHGLGTVVEEYPGSWDAARELAELTWEPVTESVYALVGMDAEGQPVFESVDGWKRVTRSDTKATLAVMRDSYEPIDHKAMGEVVEAILDQPNVKYETAGAIEGGRGVWALALLDEPVTIPGDFTLTLPYLAVLNRHDGGSAFRVTSTSVRIVCANTWKASEVEGQQTGTTFAFRHTTNWRDRVDEAREVITGVRRDFRAYCEEAERLLGIPVTTQQRELFIREFIPTPPDGLISERVQHNIDVARQAVRDILSSETTAPVAHTAYGLVQAAGEYLDHTRRARSWETRLNRSLLNTEPLKAKAVHIVRDLINA